MKKVILGSYLLVALMGSFQLEAIIGNTAARYSMIRPHHGGPTLYEDLEKPDKLGGNSSTWTPSSINQLGGNSGTYTPSVLQLQLLALEHRLIQAAEFFGYVAQVLAEFKKDDPDAFEKYFGDHKRQARAFASDLMPGLQISR